MALNKKRRWVFMWIGLGVSLAFLISGCSSLSGKKKKTSSTTNVYKDKGTSPQYYDFGDVLIPSELKVDKDESFIYKTPGFSAGVLVMKGRVERNSLISFFEGNMVKDNWQLVSSFKSPRTMMLFNKADRWCVISISDKTLDYHTHIEVWVSPTVTAEAPAIIEESGLLK